MAAIRRCFQGGTNKKDTEGHWRNTIGEKEIMLYDRIALERHDFSATRAERLQNAKHWILRLNADGPQKLLGQRPEFAVALKQCLKMQDAHLAETQQTLIPIRPQHQQRQRQNQQFEGLEDFDYCVDRKTGWRYYREPRGNPPAASSSSSYCAVADFAMANELGEIVVISQYSLFTSAEHLGDLIAADHKVLSEGCESRNNHRYAVVVQDLATQRIQSYPCKTKTSQETQKSLQKFLEPARKPKVIYTLTTP